MYSCISLLVSIMYKPEKALGTIHYTCKNYSGNTLYTKCPDTISDDLPYYRGPFIVENLFPDFEDAKSRNLCAQGNYVHACTSSTGQPYAKSEWVQKCTKGYTYCTQCATPGTVGASLEYYCPETYSDLVSVVVCSTIKINNDGTYGGHDKNYMRTYTCTASCINPYTNVIKTETDCYVSAGNALSDTTGTYTCSANAYYEN